ncbi:MAG: nucleotidyltransferase family protein [Bacteroidota bacterium]
MNPIQKHIEQIKELCTSYRVKSLFAFGSAVSEKFREDSDVDLLVEFENLDPLEYTENYFNLKFDLEDLLKHSVDLLEMKAIANPFLMQSIDRTKILVYGNGH